MTIHTKQFLICADDYAFSTANSKAIRELLKNKKINATSCMSTSEHWPEQARLLTTLLKEIPKSQRPLIGLHFCLTEPVNHTNKKLAQPIIRSWFTNNAISLPQILIRSQLRLLPKKQIYKILEFQWEQFIKHFGTLPDFIDGHQHVHQLPVVRGQIIKFLKNNKLTQDNTQNNFFVRATFPTYGIKYKSTNLADWAKLKILNICGAKKFRNLCNKNQLLTNSSFAGLYSNHDNSEQSHIQSKFLQHTPNLGLIMCHPGEEPKSNKQFATADTIYTQRVAGLVC